MKTARVQNTDALSQTPQRKDALTILEAGLAAVDTEMIMRREVQVHDGMMRIKNVHIDLEATPSIFVIGFGKASGIAAKALEDILGDKITDGVVVSTTIPPLRRIQGFIGTHPLPTVANVEATREILALLKRTTKNDVVICIISGGGSALLCDPYEATCNEFATVTEALLKSGATIEEMNTARKHLSRVHGGQLVSHASARIISLIFSDIPGGDLSMVASGPTILDNTTMKDASDILEKYAILTTCKLPSCNLTETPKDPSLFARVSNLLLCDNRLAAEAMKKKAKGLGYQAGIISTALAGEARIIGARIAKEAHENEAHIFAGETTVTIAGKTGEGGRNQEAVLASLLTIPDGALFLSCASDGMDNSLAAGAIADDITRKHVVQKKLSVLTYLEEHNSYPFFKASGDAITTGMTGINVSDLLLVLGKK